MVVLVILSEVLLIIIVLKISNCKNLILFYLINLTGRFNIFIRLLIENYNILILSNFIKLGVFPFTYIIIMFYTNLNIKNFILLNITKLPYLTLTNIKLRVVFVIATIIYLIYYIYNINNVIVIISVYMVISTIIILSINIKIIYSYYMASNISI